jgi:formylglycine-generating enzyme required for sulfatase activity
VGALDMSGNGWEWVNTAYQFYPYEKNDGREGDGDSIVVRVVRGGSIGSTGDALRTSARGRFQASYQNSDTGFRCARDFDSGDIAAAPAEATPGFAPVTHNADWTTVEREFDGVAMVLVPAGCFMMGSEEGLLNERPVHQQCFDEPFWIDKTEVANAQFARFGGEAAFNTRWSDPNVPRERISWIEAHEFCVRRGARLPTEAEWEYAARGPDNLIYPWGDTFNEQYVVYGNNSSNHTAYVGSKPLGASWVGALDMSGNVWEWTSSIYRDYPYNAGDGRENSGDESSPRVLRGGSWFNRVEDLLRTTSRSYVIPEAMVDFNGFRCARSY